ncbi:MAG TPA: hypothetical protein VGA56_06990 [Opitutaceae bacterium]
MKPAVRTLLSTTAGLGLVAYVAYCASTNGPASVNVVLGFSGLIAWALIHLIVLDLAPRANLSRPARRTEAQRVRAHAPAAIELPRIDASRPVAA